MEAQTIKVQYNNDFRRFSVSPSTTFEDLYHQIATVYKFKSNSPNEAIIKYKDDEGDFISVSSTAELHEAFSITRTQVPPILRLFMSSSSTLVPIPQYTLVQSEGIEEENCQVVHRQEQEKEEIKEEIKEIKIEIKKVEEKVKEYPYLKLSDWDAPLKVVVTETKTVPVPVLSDSIKPRTIAQSTNEESMETSRSVKSFSLSTAAQTNQSSASVIEFMNLNSVSSTSELSRDTAQSCKDLSRITSESTQEITRLTLAESVTMGDQSVVDVETLSKETVKMCHQFSKETADMLAKQARETDNHVGLLREQSTRLSELSRSTVEMGNSLSKDTSASGAEASAFILQTIMGL